MCDPFEAELVGSSVDCFLAFADPENVSLPLTRRIAEPARAVLQSLKQSSHRFDNRNLAALRIFGAMHGVAMLSF
jgi:hypothetical protein